MWEILVDFARNYKSTAIKLVLALFFVFLIVQYNSYGKRANAHTLNLQIKNGMIDRLCIASSESISFDKNGVFAMVGERRIDIPDKWASTTKKESLKIAIVMDGGRYNRRVYELDSSNARRLLQSEQDEGCRSFSKQQRKIIF